jgi:hypothetical protein
MSDFQNPNQPPPDPPPERWEEDMTDTQEHPLFRITDRTFGQVLRWFRGGSDE